MASAITEIFAEGRIVEVDLLIEMPVSSERSTWKFPTWMGYGSAFAPVQVFANQLPGGIAFRVQTQFLAKAGAWRIVAAVLSYKGQTLCVCPLLSPQYCTSETPFPIEVHGLVNPVIA